MKIVIAKRIFASFVVLVFLSIAVSAQWIKQKVNTTASLRGLSVVSERVVWASGTGGTVIRTIDGGKSWKIIVVPGAEKLDFRDIEAFDANTAYILSIGNGESSRIYKTVDGGATWKLQFQNRDEKAFFDAIACWDQDNCLAMSDPVDGHYPLISTTDGGANWKPIVSNKMPAAKEGEAAFAASGTCLITQGKNNAFLVSGGNDARVFRSTDRGQSWTVSDTPMVKGTAGSGIFSIAMLDAKNGIIVGGNYEKPEEVRNNVAFTNDGGATWRAPASASPNGYRSAVAYINSDTLIAVGSSGSDLFNAKTGTWKNVDKENYNAVQAKGRKAVWAIGAKGLVARWK
jgi:photosystem II stability/assembly factor-like uncharacterized protein